MNAKRFFIISATLLLLVLTAAQGFTYEGTWATSNGKIQVVKEGAAVKGTYISNRNSHDNFIFNCKVAADKACRGSWNFVDSGKPLGRGPITLTLPDPAKMNITMTYSDGKPMAQFSVNKVR